MCRTYPESDGVPMSYRCQTSFEGVPGNQRKCILCKSASLQARKEWVTQEYLSKFISLNVPTMFLEIEAVCTAGSLDGLKFHCVEFLNDLELVVRTRICVGVTLILYSGS